MGVGVASGESNSVRWLHSQRGSGVPRSSGVADGGWCCAGRRGRTDVATKVRFGCHSRRGARTCVVSSRIRKLTRQSPAGVGRQGLQRACAASVAAAGLYVPMSQRARPRPYWRHARLNSNPFPDSASPFVPEESIAYWKDLRMLDDRADGTHRLRPIESCTLCASCDAGRLRVRI